MRLLLVLALVIPFTSCSKKAENITSLTSEKSNKQKASKQEKALLILKAFRPWFNTLAKGATENMNEYNLSVDVKAGNDFSVGFQKDILEKAIDSGEYKVIMITPLSPVELIPSIKKAQDKGIHIVLIDSGIDKKLATQLGVKLPPLVTVDNDDAAYRTGKTALNKLSGTQKAVFLTGNEGAINREQRLAGGMRALKEYPQMEILKVQPTNWQLDEGKKYTEKILQQYPDVTLIYGQAYLVNKGALEVIKNKGSKVKLITFDYAEQMNDSIKEGIMLSSFDQDPYGLGRKGVEVAKGLLQGKNYPEIVITAGVIFTKELLENK